MPTITPLLGANPFGYALTHPCFLWLYCLLGFLLGLIAAYYMWNRAFHSRLEEADTETLRLREGILIAKRAAPALEKSRLAEQALTTARKESKVLKGHVHQLSKQVDTTSSKLDRAQQDVQLERQGTLALRQDVSTLTSNFKQAKAEATTLGNRSQHLSASVEEAQAEVSAKENALVQLKETTRETVTTMDRELSALQTDLQEKDRIIEQKNQQVRESKDGLAAQTKALETCRAQSSKLQKDLEQKHAELSNNQAKQTSIESQLKDHAAMKERLQRSETEHETLSKRLERLKGELADRDAKLADRDANNQAKQASIEAQLKDHAAMKERLQRSETEHETLSKRLERLKGELADRDAKLAQRSKPEPIAVKPAGPVVTTAKATVPLGFASTTPATTNVKTAATTTDQGLTEDPKLGLIYRQRPDGIDDLKLIKGVAQVLEKRLHEFGIYRFKQIALWNEAHEQEFSERLSFKDRIERDEWRSQAIRLHKEKYREDLKA